MNNIQNDLLKLITIDNEKKNLSKKKITNEKKKMAFKKKSWL